MFFGIFTKNLHEKFGRKGFFVVTLQRSNNKSLFYIMKTSAFVAILREAGCCLKRHGANHDIWYNPKNGNISAVPRHKTEMKKGLDIAIMRQLGLL